MANKLRLEITGFDEVIARLDELEADITSIIDEGFDKSQELVNAQLDAAIKKHHRTGETEKSLVKGNSSYYDGINIISRDVGFQMNSRKGKNLRSIYLMYGTPRAPKDAALYNAIFGAKTKRKILAIQEDNFLNAIVKYGSK